MRQTLILENIIDRLESALNQIVGVLNGESGSTGSNTCQHVANSKVKVLTKHAFQRLFEELVQCKINEAASSRSVKACRESLSETCCAFLAVDVSGDLHRA